MSFHIECFCSLGTHKQLLIFNAYSYKNLITIPIIGPDSQIITHSMETNSFIIENTSKQNSTWNELMCFWTKFSKKKNIWERKYSYIMPHFNSIYNINEVCNTKFIIQMCLSGYSCFSHIFKWMYFVVATTYFYETLYVCL